MSRPTINFASVTLDCPNQEELADFYTALLGWNKQRFDEEWLAVISPDKHICLLFQEIEDYIPPVWPNEKGKQQQMTHLDFASTPNEKDAVKKSCSSLWCYFGCHTIFTRLYDFH